MLTSTDRDDLATLDIGPRARATIEASLDEGMVVLVPSERVSLGALETIGWWRVDPTRGTAIGMMESGGGEAALLQGTAEDLTIKILLQHQAHAALCFFAVAVIGYWSTEAAATSAVRGCFVFSTISGFGMFPAMMLESSIMWTITLYIARFAGILAAGLWGN